MQRHGVSWILMVGLLLSSMLAGGQSRAAAQGDPDAWTDYAVNLRAGPGTSHAVLATLDPNTPLIVEAHDGAVIWLLVHEQSGSPRGWVAANYLRYREGFSAARLPVSDELVSSGAAAAASAPADQHANGAIEALEFLYGTGHSEYYRLVYWSDGLRVTGFIGWPTDTTRYHPAIIYNRGGAWNTGALKGGEIVPLVESGYVAVASNYRGNAGSEGQEQFGWDDVHDVLNLIPLLDALPQVDGLRIGMVGGSRGGMVTYMALKTESMTGQHRIRAAVTVGGIADLFLWAKENPSMVQDIYLPLIGTTPAESYAPFQMRSATYWPQLINSPLLLLHGEADTTVPVEQAYKLYNALKAAGKDVTLVTYPGDDHPLTGQLGGYPEALRYLDRYLGGDGVDRQFDSHWPQIQDVSAWFWQHQG